MLPYQIGARMVNASFRCRASAAGRVGVNFAGMRETQPFDHRGQGGDEVVGVDDSRSCHGGAKGRMNIDCTASLESSAA